MRSDVASLYVGSDLIPSFPSCILKGRVILGRWLLLETSPEAPTSSSSSSSGILYALLDIVAAQWWCCLPSNSAKSCLHSEMLRHSRSLRQSLWRQVAPAKWKTRYHCLAALTQFHADDGARVIIYHSWTPTSGSQLHPGTAADWTATHSQAPAPERRQVHAGCGRFNQYRYRDQLDWATVADESWRHPADHWVPTGTDAGQAQHF